VISITLTIDLEDPTGAYAPGGRWVQMTRRLLDFCDKINRRATIFTVGRAAEAAPDLIKTIAARGHEIAYHTRGHVPLTQENPERFRREAGLDKDALEQLSGKNVTGFRAPGFSLTPETLWAVDILKELGFRYSASVMPTRISRYGFPKAPRAPFRWPNGLIELPQPDATPMRLPYLGGVYLYALPAALSRAWAARAKPSECLWTYTHPFDVDTEAPFAPVEGAPLWMSGLLWVLRRWTEKKIFPLLASPAPPLGERLDAEGFANAKEYIP